MVDIKNAHEILGVRQGATRDEIIKRYDILLKKYKMNKAEGSEEAVSGVSINEINQAYNLLMGYDTGQEAEEDINKKPNPILKKLNIDEKKAQNFWHYHKFHVLIGLVILIVIITTVNSCVNRVNPDLNISIVGEIYFSEDTEVIEKGIKEKIPDLKAPNIDMLPISDKLDGQQAYAYQMKLVATMAAGDVDVFITDKVNFEKLVKQGAFIPLDDLADELGIDREKNKEYALNLDNQGNRLYGIDIKNSSFFKQYNVAAGEMVVAIKVKTKYYDNAVKLLKLLAK